MSQATGSIPGGAAKLITCVLRDNGMDRRLLKLLHDVHGVTRIDSINCRGVDILQAAKAQRNRVPEGKLSRLVKVVVDEAQAEELFDFICMHAGLNEPGSGSVYMVALKFATPLVMPTGVPSEADADDERRLPGGGT